MDLMDLFVLLLTKTFFNLLLLIPLLGHLGRFELGLISFLQISSEDGALTFIGFNSCFYDSVLDACIGKENIEGRGVG